jgi:hypothetical protein
MSEITTQPGQSSTSTTEQVKERASEGAQKVKEKASEAKMRTRERLREQIDTRSTETGGQMTSTASALRETAQRLRGNQQEPQARVLDQIAERADRFGRYLTDTDGDRLLRDVENVARRRPWLVAGGGTVLGFLAARFTKASSSRRYEADGGDGSSAAVRSAQSRPALSGGSAVVSREVSVGGDV